MNEETPVVVKEAEMFRVAWCRYCHEGFAYRGCPEGDASDDPVGCSHDLERDAFLTNIRQAFPSSSHEVLAFGLTRGGAELIFCCCSWKHH